MAAGPPAGPLPSPARRRVAVRDTASSLEEVREVCANQRGLPRFLLPLFWSTRPSPPPALVRRPQPSSYRGDGALVRIDFTTHPLLPRSTRRQTVDDIHPAWISETACHLGTTGFDGGSRRLVCVSWSLRPRKKQVPSNCGLTVLRAQLGVSPVRHAGTGR